MAGGAYGNLPGAGRQLRLVSKINSNFSYVS